MEKRSDQCGNAEAVQAYGAHREHRARRDRRRSGAAGRAGSDAGGRRPGRRRRRLRRRAAQGGRRLAQARPTPARHLHAPLGRLDYRSSRARRCGNRHAIHRFDTSISLFFFSNFYSFN